MRRLPLALTALGFIFSACSMPMTGGSASPTPTATPTPTPSATPTAAPTPTLINGRITVSNLDANGPAVGAGTPYPPTGRGRGAGAKYERRLGTDGRAQRRAS